MTTSPPTPQQIAAFNRLMDGFFELFEWSHGVAIEPYRRADVKDAVAAHWSDPDNAVKELMRYVAALHATVFVQPQHRRDQLRRQVWQIFQDLFTKLEANGRGQVLGALHAALETLRPGCTGVVLPFSTTPQPPPAPASSPIHHPLPGVASAQPARPAPAQWYPAQQPPAMPTAAPPVQPMWTAGTGQFDPYAMSAVPDTQRILRQAEIRQQNMMLEQKIWDMQHQTVMKILN